MNNKQKRINFSLIRIDGNYRVQCDETKELVSGKISNKKQAEKILKDHVSTENFLSASKNMTKEEVSTRMKLFGGRLRPKKKPWTIEEATLVASVYNTRGELYKQNQKCYLSAYQKGWLEQICAHMKPSRKVNKFVYGVLNPNAALAKIFDYPTHHEFAINNQSAYDALRRFGINSVELFENRDNAEYLKSIIRKLAQDSIDKFVSDKTV